VGEAPNRPFQLSFNASLKIDFQGLRVTSDGGLILVRELDKRLGFGELIHQYLTDSPREEYAVSFRRLAAAVGVQPLGGLRGRERRRAPLAGPYLSTDRFGEDLGAGRSAAAGREPPDAAAVWSHAEQNRGALVPSGLANRRPNRISCHEEKAGGNVSKASVERGAVSDFGILRSGKSGGFRWRWRLRTLKTRLTLAFRGGQAYVFAGSESIMEIPA